jgi:hypothetical protein
MFETIATELTGRDYGLLGALVIPIVGTFIWFVRAMRGDLKEDRAAFREDIKESHSDFTEYLKETAEKQTEALVSVGNALQMSMRASEAHEDRANTRHHQVLRAIEAVKPPPRPRKETQ